MPATILLFHSALGLRPAVHRFADDLRTAGHTVHTPDLYDGEVFESLDAGGVAKRESLGIPEVARRGAAAAAELTADLVYAGFSLGAGPAQMLAQTRPGARGALLMHGCLPSAMFGTPWPGGVPLAIHTMEGDPWVELDVARALASEAEEGELHIYPGTAHLFADEHSPEYDEAAARAMLERALAFLERLDAPG
jgi:dienelactone hydrolase